MCDPYVEGLIFMKDEESFRETLADKQIPLLLLDSKWHRLFAIHGKTDLILRREQELNGLLAEQGKYNQELKDLRKLKAKLMESIVRNMDGANENKADSLESRKLEENRRLIGEVNEKIEASADRLLELPHLIRKKNEELMIASMEYCYEKMRVNAKEAEDIAEWIRQVRIELKKNIIRKQNCEINNREIYAFMHDIFGPQIIDIFDIQYEDDAGDGEDETGDDGHPEE